MTAALRPTLGQAFRRAALPLGWYYAVTLALPIANGATQAGAAFVGHALIVLVVPPILIGLMCAVRVVISAFPFDIPMERVDTPLAWLIERRPKPTCSRARWI
jgi:hypothetical protein